ncbi:hypothetical protein CXB51_035687 [Gossypium anomalum]|uniref:Pathogenesis-related protein 1 n=1 Tax=Gossypium anomalum TaxID=47600 RepID=A0A8J6CMT2_9ROSI|nr:hypothetical protein CXB51_035687 [Gossypium anomalum]
MELCRISVAFSLVVLALFSRTGTHGSIGATQPGSIQYVKMAAAPNPASAENGSSPQDFLNVHNAARAAVGVRPITWTNLVARYAADYAEKRISDCDLVHSGGPYGENLAWSSGDLSGPDAVRLWIDEKDYYNLKSGVCNSSHVCGHYTQVIWRNSVRLGCAKARCNNGGTFIVCNYDPPGNFVGQLPIDVNQSISRAISPSAAPAPYFFPSEHPKRNMGRLGVGLIVGACGLIFGLGLFFWFFSRTKRHKDDVNIDNHDHISDVFFSGGEFRYGMAPRKFSLVELAKVTNNFKDEKLGEGGFGAVYRGHLRDLDTYVAVKGISKASKQGIKEYASDVKIISRLRHKNLVKLIGWCHEKRELLLVYEFMANGSLDSHLFKGKSLPNWEVRYKIVQDLASALLYLHEEGDHCVLHRDIKTINIMLNSKFNAKLGDFGLARLVDHAKGSQTTRLAGTMGYMAPECVSAGKVSKESDVYSFGIVALEIACGRRSIEPEYEESKASFVAWVWDSYGNQRLLDVLNFEAPLPELPGSRPIPTYDAPIASGVKASEPCFSSLTITVPR